MNDAGADAADAADANPDAKSCLPNGTPITPQSDNCCSGYGHNGVCEAHCYPKGSACELPDRPCCADSGATCINGGCQ